MNEWPSEDNTTQLIDQSIETNVPSFLCTNRSQDPFGNTPCVTYVLTFAAPWAAKTFWQNPNGTDIRGLNIVKLDSYNNLVRLNEEGKKENLTFD